MRNVIIAVVCAFLTTACVAGYSTSKSELTDQQRLYDAIAGYKAWTAAAIVYAEYCQLQEIKSGCSGVVEQLQQLDKNAYGWVKEAKNLYQIDPDSADYNLAIASVNQATNLIRQKLAQEAIRHE